MYPIKIQSSSGESIDEAGNVESAVSILYGDLSTHDGNARTIFAPAEYCQALRAAAAENADCWGIPLDIVKESTP